MTHLPVCSGEVNSTIASSIHYCVPTTCAYTIYTHHILCNIHLHMYTYMWQSRVEIEHYSVACFDRIAAFEALQRRTSVKGRAHTHCVNVASIDEFTQCI